MQHNCERHTFETSEGVCRSCNGTFCADCLLYPFGREEAPYCKPCALTAGGVRSTAANPRRVLPEGQGPKKRSGGLFGRLRRSAGAADDDAADQRTPAEIMEQEAEEARRMLDAQRLPGDVEDDPEEELPPLPNIAPPAAAGDEPELRHRSVRDEIAGGLELHAEDDPLPPPEPDADATPLWARPEAAEQALPPHPPAAHAAEGQGALDDAAATPSPSTPGEISGARDAPLAAAPAIDAAEAGPAIFGPERGPEVPVAERAAERERAKTVDVVAETRTADGVPLFAPSTAGAAEPTDFVGSKEQPPSVPNEPSGRPAPEPSGPGVNTAPASRDYAADTRELLRRISELRGR